jgi:predicted CoA-binding protein
MLDSQITKTLKESKVVAMIGVSSISIQENSKSIRRRPSTIVMKYLQEFGYRVIPINPFSAGKKVHGEIILSKLEDIKIPIDIVNVFRPSSETPEIAKQTIKTSAKIFWLQFGINSLEAKKIVEDANIEYIGNKCIKQEYQRLFLKMNPVFPVLK